MCALTPGPVVDLSGFHPASACAFSISSLRPLCSLCALGCKRVNHYSLIFAVGSCLRNAHCSSSFTGFCLRSTLRCTFCSDVTTPPRRLPRGRGCRWPKASDSATFLRLQEWRKIFVSIEHVPGFENSDADAVSRGSVPALYSASWQRTISPFLGTISCPPDSPVIPGFRFFAICSSGLSWYLAVFRVPVKPCSIGLWISGHTNLRPVRFRRTFEILRISGSGSRSETGPA